MKFLRKIDLEINKDIYDPIKVKQNDTARYLLFNLLDNRVPFSLENKTVRVYGVKPDGTKVFNNLTIVDANRGLAELQLTTQMLIRPGCLKLELVIYEATDILSTTKFDIDIISCIRDDGAIESTNEFSALTVALAKADEYGEALKQGTENIELIYATELNGVKSSLEEKVNKEQGKGLSTNDYTNTDKAEVAKVKDKLDKVKLLDLTYPVGSIYMSVNNTNPSSLFGGTWVEFSKGKTLVGVDASQTEFNTVEKTGGEKTHKLIIDEMPIHTPKWNGYSAGNLYTGSGSSVTHALFGNDTWRGSTSNGIQPVGGDKAHNNLQPYITCYMWKRTE